MKVTVLMLTVVGAAAIATGAGRATLNAQQAASGEQPKTQWDGVYTEDQAKRGEPLYTKSCASCHSADLKGTDKAPALVGEAFNGNYDNLKMSDLTERVRVTMPVDNPGSLTRAQTSEIVAFMLLKAGAPAGAADLPTNADRLGAIKITAKKP